MLRCSGDSLLCAGGGGEGVGMGAGAHHSSGVGVVVGDGVGIGAGTHQSSDAGVSGVLLRLCAVMPSSARPVARAALIALLIGMGDGGVGAV